MALLFQSKIRQNKQSTIANLKEQRTFSTTNENHQSLTFKGRALLNLTYHNKATIKYTLRRWYMISTVAAYNLFQKAVINLVLYTNIHKISFFYRLQRTIKNRMIINPKIKKIAIIIYLLMKNATKITKKTTF